MAGALQIANLPDPAPQTDQLTGLANRVAWEAELANMVASNSFPLSVVVIELDCVTPADAFADRRLAEAAAAFRGSLRSTDLVARIGRGEFSVVLQGCGSGEAAHVAERLRNTVPPGQSATIGSASWDGSEGAASLIARAGEAVKAATPQRRDRVSLGA